MERRRRRGRLRRLPQPALGRRLRQGERGAAHRHDASPTPGSRTPTPTTTSSARSTRPATRARPSNEVTALPHLTIGWANLQWPPTLNHTISVDRPHRRRLRPGLDRRRHRRCPARPTACSRAARLRPRRLDARRTRGRGSRRPSTRRPASNDEFVAIAPAGGRRHVRLRLPLLDDRRPRLGLRRPGRDRERLQPGPGGQPDGEPERRHDGPGGADRASRRHRPRRPGSSWPGTRSPATRRCTATRSGARPAAAARTRRSPASPARGYTDTGVTQGETYHYVVRSLDGSFNRSADSAPVSATAALRTVSIVFTVTVPATTDATGRDGLHRRLPQPARRRAAGVEPGRRRADPRSTRRTGG